MVDNVAEPVVVPANAGTMDALQAAARYAVVLVGAGTALMAFVRVHDYAGLAAYLQTNGGQIMAAVSGLIAIGTAAYGVFKSHKRGAQIVTVASSAKVPNSVASLKQ